MRPSKRWGGKTGGVVLPAASRALCGTSTLPGNASSSPTHLQEGPGGTWNLLETPAQGASGKEHSQTQREPALERASHGIHVLGSKWNNKASEEEPLMERSSHEASWINFLGELKSHSQNRAAQEFLL